MGWFSDVCSAVSSACRSVCNAVTSVVSSAVELTTKVGSMALEGLRGVAAVICNVAQALGFMRVDESAKDLGDRFIQAEGEGITLDSCKGDYELYMDKIRNFKLDPEKSKNISDDDKLRATSVVMGARIEQHYGQSIAPLIPMMARMPDFLSGGRLKSFLDAGISLSKVGGYFSSNLDRRDTPAVEAQLIKQEKAIAPTADDQKLRDMLRSMQE